MTYTANISLNGEGLRPQEELLRDINFKNLKCKNRVNLMAINHKPDDYLHFFFVYSCEAPRVKSGAYPACVSPGFNSQYCEKGHNSIAEHHRIPSPEQNKKERKRRW